MASLFSRLRSRMKFFDSFFGLSHRFKVMILSEIFEILTYPQWFSIYLKKELGANDTDIGLVNAVRNGVNLFLQPAGGAIGQKFSKKRLYLLGLLLQASAFLIALLAKDWTWAIFMSIVLGCEALVGPGIGALIGEITDRSTRATVFALESTIISIVTMLRGPIQGFIAETIGLRYLYLLAVIGVMISFFLFSRFFSEREEKEKLPKDETIISKSKLRVRKDWKEQVRQVFAKPDYRRNFIGLLQAGVVWRLFYAGFAPFISIYLYEEIGWSFLFFGFFGFISSFMTIILKIPFGKFMDKYRLRRLFFFIGPAIFGIEYLLLAFIRDPYQVTGIFLVDSVVSAVHSLSVGALWYDAIPLKVYSIGSAIRGVFYGCSSVAGSLIGAYLWADFGPASSFYIIFASEIARGLVALYLIRDLKEENK